MELVLSHIKSTANYTIGEFHDEINRFMCNTLEDEYRAVKVKGETRIPDGRYKLGLGPVNSGLTQKYRDDKRLKPWFERHIQILNVPNFSGIYIHIGNHDKHTDGCVLLGTWDGHSPSITNSVIAYTNFYKKYFPLLKAGKEIYLTIKTVA